MTGVVHHFYVAGNAASYAAAWMERSLRWIRRTTAVSVALLAAIAASVSDQHMHTPVLRHGETRWAAVLIPLSVDGMVVASSMSILMASRLGRRGERLPWTLLIIGSLASLAANVVVAEPSLVGLVIVAWPSFAFVGAYHLFQGQFWIGCVVLATRSDESEADPQGHSLGDGGEGALLLENPGRRLQRQAWEWALANRAEDGRLPGRLSRTAQ